jgi:hypothetical protein
MVASEEDRLVTAANPTWIDLAEDWFPELKKKK